MAALAGLLVDEPSGSEPAPTLVLAHGAGAPMDSPFLKTVAISLSTAGVRVARFEFPYMAARRDGRRPGPDREPVLRQTWLSVIEQLGGGAGVFIGGKSMGGRIASLVADEAGVRGLVCLGYPFHPPGKPERLRTKHLASLRTPTRIVQGTRDPFGTREDVAGYTLSKAIELVWLEDGGHSFETPKRAARTSEQNVALAIEAVRAFVKGG